MHKLVSVAVFLCGAAASAMYAAPITGGFVRVEGLSGSGTFQLVGDSFNVQGVVKEGNWPTGSIVPIGTTVPVSGQAVGTSFGFGFGQVMGSDFPSVDFGALEAAGASWFQFFASDILIGPPGLYTGTFQFNGRLCGVNWPLQGPAPYPCDLYLPSLEGHGWVELVVVASGVPEVVYVQQATYNFVPEPSTLFLGFSTLVLFGVRYHLGYRR
jgi:hypothetical protein